MSKIGGPSAYAETERRERDAARYKCMLTKVQEAEARLHPRMCGLGIVPGHDPEREPTPCNLPLKIRALNRPFGNYLSCSFHDSVPFSKSLLRDF